MRYAFTGPSKLTVSEAEAARAVVENLEDPTEIVTGGADGWDTAVAFAAVRTHTKARHVVIVPAAAYNRAALPALRALAYMLGSLVEVVQAPERATPAAAYRVRNEIMVARADVLVAGLRDRAFYRSGEWMTVNIATNAGVAVHVVDLWDCGQGGERV